MNKNLLKKLDRVYAECSERYWDGYGAEPADTSIRPTVEQFLKLLPSDIPDPDIGCDPDGEISLGWYKGKKGTFSISIGKKNQITYAVFENNTMSRLRGTEEFDERKIPHIIDYALKRFWRDKL